MNSPIRRVARECVCNVFPLAYTRDGSVVRLDVDGDGHEERIGRAPRVSFEVRTAVAVAVPPAPRGVGDTDGVADERSPGWGG